MLTTNHGIVTEASFTTSEDRAHAGRRFKARWGKPRITGDNWFWYRGDRTITAAFDGANTTITLARR